MDAWSLLYAASVHVLAVLCLVLIFDKRYDDGLFGRLALIAIAIASLLSANECWAQEAYTVHRTTAILAAGFALFMMRHALRFLLVRWKCPLKVGVPQTMRGMPSYLE